MTQILLGWFRWLTSITISTIADNITQIEFLPQNLQQCLLIKPLGWRQVVHLSEGVNMAQRTMVMNIDLDGDDEINLIKDKPTDGQQAQGGQSSFDSYDPVVGKWKTNLVATTPITAKAMKKSLYRVE